MTKQYSWEVGAIGSLTSNMDANKVGAELEKLGEDITASGVVALARKKSSAMHDYFEWDDSIAGEKYRESQARTLIKMLKVSYVKNGAYRKKLVKDKVTMYSSFHILEELCEIKGNLTISSLENTFSFRYSKSFPATKVSCTVIHSIISRVSSSIGKFPKAISIFPFFRSSIVSLVTRFMIFIFILGYNL